MSKGSDAVLELANALVAEVRWLRQQWATQKLPDIDPFEGALARAEQLVGALEDATGSAADARWAVFGARLAATGDVQLASLAVGRTARWGNRQLAAYPEIVEAAVPIQRRAPKDWKEMHPEALAAVAHALDHGEVDEKLKAAALVIERVEGKVPQRIDVEAEGNLLETVFWRYVTGLHLAKGMAFEEAQRLAEQNPEAVQEWGRRVGLIGGGAEPVQEAEVVGNRAD